MKCGLVFSLLAGLCCSFLLKTPAKSPISWTHQLPQSLEAMSLNKNLSLPIPLAEDKSGVMKQIHTLLDHFKLWAEGVERPSIGCSVRPMSMWFKHAPTNSYEMCNTKTLLIYSQQHSGTSVVASALNDIPSILPIHEFFCCDHPRCLDRTVGITTYLQLACALGVHQLGVRVLSVGLQEAQFWGLSLGDAVHYPKKHNSYVLILMRSNWLAHELGGTGRTIDPTPEILSKKIYQHLYKRQKRHMLRFANMYCGLLSVGVRTLMITYENLEADLTGTINQVTQFVGEDQPWTPPPHLLGHRHVPVKNRIKNLGEVTDYLKEKYPEYLCLLDETCDFPPVDCSKKEYSQPLRPPRKKKYHEKLMY